MSAEIRRERRRAAWLAATLAGMTTFGVGYFAGQAKSELTLVQCQEDEVWYPADFTGDVSIQDLKCTHIEELTTP